MTSKLQVVIGGVFLIIISFYMLGIFSEIMFQFFSIFQPVIDSISSSQPWLATWIDYYKLTWNYLPVLVLGAIILWMFLKANYIDAEERYRTEGGF